MPGAAGMIPGTRCVGPHDATFPRASVVKPAEPVQASHRARLALPSSEPLAGMDDDTNLAQTFPLQRFGLGSTRDEQTECDWRAATKDRVFLSGFESDVTEGSHSRLSINNDCKWIYVHAAPTQTTTTPPALLPLEAEIPFDDISPGGIRVVRGRSCEDGQLVTMTITTRRPARFYTKLKGLALMRRATERDFVFSVGPSESIPGRTVEEMKAKGFIILEGHAGPIEVVSDNCMALPMNSWLTWKFEMMMGSADLKRFRAKILRLRDMLVAKRGYDVLAPTASRVPNPSVERMHFVNVPELLDKLSLSFPVRYLVEAIVSTGACPVAEIPKVLEALHKSCPSDDLQERVLSSLIGEDCRFNIPSLVAERAKLLRKRRLRTESHQTLTYRCSVTPTHVRLHAPGPEISSDAFRQSPVPANRFLYVQFTDEDGPVFVSEQIQQADTARPELGTLARIRRALDFGLNVAGRHYVFLAFSTTSLHDRSCWFIAETERCTADDVRKALGFNAITDRVPAQYASRMGILFTPSKVIQVAPNIRKPSQDVYTKNKASNFTEGAGRCGRAITQQAAKLFGWEEGVNASPSAIQFQCGGITGVLSVSPDCSSYDVVFRRSQIMFETGELKIKYGLNVLRISQYRRACLNRQLLLLLRHMGVDEHELLGRVSDYMRRSLGLTERFEKNVPEEADRRASERLSRFPIYELASAGFNQNEMVLEACRVVEARLLSDLRWDGKLEIGESVCLMGVPDEAGVLEAGEIFCKCVDPDDPLGRDFIATGQCVVMRDSALHPGEIQRVIGVDRPELRHLTNVIVFPVRAKQGEKPLPETLSGGSLGGDDYILIFDNLLQPRRTQAPVKFRSRQGKMVNRVQMQHLKEFFVDYISKDVLQDVLTAHLAHSDLSGPTSVDCLALASEAYIARKFAFTGVPPQLQPDLVPTEWPHFLHMDGIPPSARTYDSLELVQKIFSMTSAPSILDTIDRRGGPSPRRDSRLEKFQVPPSVLDDAYKLKIDYEDSLRSIMQRFSVSEPEVVCGSILRGRPLRQGDIETENRMYQAYLAVKGNILAHADKFLGRRVFKGKLQPRQIYALAAYQITYVNEVIEAVEERLGIKRDAWSDGVASTTLSPIPSTPASTRGSTVPSSMPPSTCPSSVGSLNDGPFFPPKIERLISFPWVFWEALRDLNLPDIRV